MKKCFVRCIDDGGGSHTIGKVYEVDGEILESDDGKDEDNGLFLPPEVKTVDDINGMYKSQFELVEGGHERYAHSINRPQDSPYKSRETRWACDTLYVIRYRFYRRTAPLKQRNVVWNKRKFGGVVIDFKVKCVEAQEEFTAGKLYDVKNGQIIDDDGEPRPVGRRKYFKSLETLNDRGFYGKFELVEEEKMFTKDDLKVGYVVEHRNGDIAMVAEYSMQKALVRDDGVYTRFDSIGDDLMTEWGHEYDVMKVYGLTPNPSMARNSKTINRPLLWERKPEITTLSMEKIADKFGVPVENLRIKE